MRICVTVLALLFGPALLGAAGADRQGDDKGKQVEVTVRRLIGEVRSEQMSRHLFYLAQDPLPYRKLNHTLPGHEKSTLDEADDYITGQLAGWGYPVEREPVPVQAFRCDASKPKAHQYSKPEPDDPWYTAHNLHAIRGHDPIHAAPNWDRVPELRPATIVVCSHKDSPSWADSPGAYDNAVGTAANLEIARVLSTTELPVTVWHLFCNEEHTPWTSVHAAQKARAREDRLIAVLNTDSIGGKSQADTDAGRKTNVTGYTTPEGKRLADLMAVVNADYGLGLIQRSFRRESPGDDDGSFVNAGFPAAVINVGSMPYADPHYHAEGDTAEHVDIENVHLSSQAVLAALLTLALDAGP